MKGGNMRKAITIMVVVALVLTFTGAAYAEDGPLKKLGRGVANVITCAFQLPKGIGDAHDENGIFAGLSWGVVLGTFNVVKRALVGVYEIATFPIPLPEDYQPILTDPEFFLDSY